MKKMIAKKRNGFRFLRKNKTLDVSFDWHTHTHSLTLCAGFFGFFSFVHFSLSLSLSLSLSFLTLFCYLFQSVKSVSHCFFFFDYRHWELCVCSEYYHTLFWPTQHIRWTTVIFFPSFALVDRWTSFLFLLGFSSHTHTIINSRLGSFSSLVY